MVAVSSDPELTLRFANLEEEMKEELKNALAEQTARFEDILNDG